ncbi:MAG: sigma-70 family RNA polymerase sigma factor [Myxococcales bacterium]|nr:MAG: sigma-70 family RNA polymerase sigma factor [Myxococcales bacterium]
MSTTINPTAKKYSSAFETVALPHMNYIYKVAFHLCGDRALAEDLAQETMFIAMQKFEQLQDHAKCKSWLFVILRNLYWGKMEKERHRSATNFDDVAYGIADEGLEAEREWREGFSDDVQRQLDRLDEKYKTPLIMSILGNYSYKEIADSLEIPIGTVMSRIARGKTFLRREISKSMKSQAA